MVAPPTVFAGELYLDDGIAAVLHGRRPTDTRLAGRTARVLLAPIDLEVLGIKAGPLAGLPVIVETRGPQQVHVVGVLSP